MTKGRFAFTSRAESALAAVVAVMIAGASACGSAGQDDPKAGSGAGGGVITGAAGSGGHGPASTSASSSTSGAGGKDGGVPKGPPYPIVLAHGFFGFNDFAGAGFLTYFVNVKKTLEAAGEVVDTPAVDPFNDSDFRGDQLITHIEDLLAKTGASKVNIIGHSQGGLDARAVAHKRPDLVASVVTIGTPHYGTPVADIAVKLLADPNAANLIDELAKLLGGPLYDQINQETSLTKPLHLFSKPGIADFNLKHPDAPSVFYASIGGRSSLHGLDNACKGDIVVPFIKPWESTLDPIDPALSVTALVLDGGLYNYANDGLVRSTDMRWGEFCGCVPGDHLDEIGQLFGDSPGGFNDFDHYQFYRDLVAYIRATGV